MKVDNLNRTIASVENLITNLDRNITVVREENERLEKKLSHYSRNVTRILSFVTKIYNRIVTVFKNAQKKYFEMLDTKIEVNNVSVIKATKLRNNLEKLFE